MRSRGVAVAVATLTVALAAGVLQATTASAHERTPYCGIRWGSLAKSSPEMTAAPITGARAGRHECFDRLVVDLGGKPAAGYRVRYVDGFHQDGSGDRLAVSGGAILRIDVLAPSYDANGKLTVPWKAGSDIVNVGGFRTFRDVVYGGSFEGQTAIGVGVRARLPFRVFKLDGPGGGSRLVVDVAHRW